MTWFLKLEHTIWIILGQIFVIWPSFCVIWLWSWLVMQCYESSLSSRQESHRAANLYVTYIVMFSIHFVVYGIFLYFVMKQNETFNKERNLQLCWSCTLPVLPNSMSFHCISFSWKHFDVTVSLVRPGVLLISAPSLGVYYYFLSLTVSLCASVRLPVCHGQTSNLFFFFVSRWNQAIFGRQFSIWHSTNVVLRFLILAP